MPFEGAMWGAREILKINYKRSMMWATERTSMGSLLAWQLQTDDSKMISSATIKSQHFLLFDIFFWLIFMVYLVFEFSGLNYMRSPPGPYHTFAGQECRGDSGGTTRERLGPRGFPSIDLMDFHNGMTTLIDFFWNAMKWRLNRFWIKFWVPFWYHVFGKTGSAIISSGHTHNHVYKISFSSFELLGVPSFSFPGDWGARALSTMSLDITDVGRTDLENINTLVQKLENLSCRAKSWRLGYGWPPRIKFQNTTYTYTYCIAGYEYWMNY